MLISPRITSKTADDQDQHRGQSREQARQDAQRLVGQPQLLPGGRGLRVVAGPAREKKLDSSAEALSVSMLCSPAIDTPATLPISCRSRMFASTRRRAIQRRASTFPNARVTPIAVSLQS